MVSQPTVTDRQGSSKHAFPREPGPGNRRSLFGWLRREPEPTPPARPTPTSRIHQPDPAPTQRLPRVPGDHPGDAPSATHGPVHREHATDPDDIAVNLIGLSAWGLKHEVSSTALLAELTPCWEELQKRSAAELEKGRASERRRQNSAAVAESVGRALEGAVMLADATGAPLPDPLALGSRLAAVAANAHALDDRTMQFQAITPDTPDPRITVVPARQQYSPVHHDNGIAPPMPAGDPVQPEPLPHRDAQAPLLARMVDDKPAEENAQQRTARDLAAGARLLRQVHAPGGFPYWSWVPVVEVTADAETVLVGFADGSTADLVAQAPVWVLPAEAPEGGESA